MPTPTTKPALALHPLLALLALGLACSQAGEGTSASASSTTSDSGESDAESATTTATTTGASATTSDASASASATTSASATDGTESGDLCGNGVIDPGEVCDGAALDGQTCVGLGEPYIGGELGCSPLCTAYDASGCEVDAGAPALRINEILGKGAIEGEYADMGDLIEVYNAGGEVADLSGFKLSDEPDFPADKTYVFAEGASLAPGAWLVLVAYDDVAMTGDFPFGISTSKEETVSLADPGGVVVDAITFDGALSEVSYCRLPDGEDAWSACAQTPGAANMAADAMPGVCGDGVIDRGEACDGAALGGATCQSLSDTFSGGTLACADACAYDTGGCVTAIKIAVNEVSSSDLDPIEIYNAGAAPVDLSGWILTDDTTDPYDPDADAEKLILPPGTTLGAKGFLVISKGMGAMEHPFGLGAGGDAVRLFDKDVAVIDAMTYGDGEAAVSYCRVPDGPSGLWKAGCAATFGGANKGP